MSYPGFWYRWAAHLIDNTIFGLASLVLAMLFLPVFTDKWMELTVFLSFYLLVLLVLGIWFPYRYGGTTGKLLLRLRVTMKNGSPMTLKASALRFTGQSLLPMAVLAWGLISYMMQEDAARIAGAVVPGMSMQGEIAVLFPSLWLLLSGMLVIGTAQKRALSDLMGGTVVQLAHEKKGVPATFWRRIWAAWLDFKIFLIACAVISYALFEEHAWTENYEVILSLCFVAYVMLRVGMVERFGVSPGKALLRLRVEMQRGGKPTFWAIVMRMIGQILGVVTGAVLGMVIWYIYADNAEVLLQAMQMGDMLNPQDPMNHLIELKLVDLLISVAVTMLAWLLISASLVMLRNDRRSLSDLVSGTKVIHQ